MGCPPLMPHPALSLSPSLVLARSLVVAPAPTAASARIADLPHRDGPDTWPDTVLGLSMMMIFKYQVTKALRGRSQDDAVSFLCAPRPQMVEQNWERILKHALKLRKKHITTLLETMVP